MENSTFRTQLKIKPEHTQIDHSSEILLFGSCFSENMGNKFDYFKYKSSTNPYGILFNPIAIANAITECIQNKKYTEKDLILHNELWHSFNHHSDYSDIDKQVVLDNINASIEQAHVQLKKASHIIITYGTSWTYEYIETQRKVANCHKIPQKKFEKKLLSIEEIENSIVLIKNSILKLNPNATIIFTVSPVRHLKDGMLENNLSKSHLIAAIHNSLDENSNYFPAYEIMMDDLRDYRFYKDDMVHPNQLAVDYIWTLFNKTWITQQAQEMAREIDQIQKGLNHKPFNPDSIAHQKFKINLSKKIDKLNKDLNRTFF